MGLQFLHLQAELCVSPANANDCVGENTALGFMERLNWEPLEMLS